MAILLAVVVAEVKLARVSNIIGGSSNSCSSRATSSSKVVVALLQILILVVPVTKVLVVSVSIHISREDHLE